MKRMVLIAALIGAALGVSAAPASAREDCFGNQLCRQICNENPLGLRCG